MNHLHQLRQKIKLLGKKKTTKQTIIACFVGKVRWLTSK